MKLNLITAIDEFEKWHNENRTATRLQKHEALKALLFTANMQNNPSLEYKITGYDGKRSGLIDYIDNDNAVEIDDGPNIKSIRKLVYARDVLNKTPLWILVLTSGNGGKARRIATEYQIPMVKLFARNNYFRQEAR